MSQKTLLTQAVDAALKLAETEPWQSVTLAQIARETGHTLSDFHALTQGQELSAEIDPMLDLAMSEGSLDPEERPRTRLFDVIMLRFEAMEARRDGIMSFLRWRDSHISGLSLRVRQRYRTARWALVCAGLDSASPLPQEIQSLAVAYAIAAAERAWRQETGTDLTRTMARLDAELLKLEKRVDWLKRARKANASDDA